MKVLFICNQNQNRSKTAESFFVQKFTTRSRGLYNDKPVSMEDMEWADLVAVMETAQRKELGIRFPSLYLKKKIVCLDIPDLYGFNQPELVSLLSSKEALLATH